MLGTLIVIAAVVLVLLGAVGVATLWAEYGGRRPPPPREDEGRPDEEGEPGDEDAEADERPWERPGAVRLDCEPHRGPTLVWLGRLSLWIIASAMLVGAVALLPIIPLAITVLVLASRDRARMRAGTMDPAGEGPTRKAARYAVAALAMLALFVLAVGGLIAYAIFFTDT
jgi:hypothetical protein